MGLSFFRMRRDPGSAAVRGAVREVVPAAVRLAPPPPPPPPPSARGNPEREPVSLPFDPQAVPIRQLPARIADISDEAALAWLRAVDPRSSAVRIYDARIAQIRGLDREE